MPSLIKPHFPPGTMRCSFSPERILPPPPFAIKMTFPAEGPIFSAAVFGTRAAEGINGGVICTPTRAKPARDKLKDACSSLLYWEKEQFEEVEVVKNFIAVWTWVFINFLCRNLCMTLLMSISTIQPHEPSKYRRKSISCMIRYLVATWSSPFHTHYRSRPCFDFPT